MYLSTYLFVYLFFCLSVCLSIYLSTYLLSIYISIYLSIYLHITIDKDYKFYHITSGATFKQRHSNPTHYFEYVKYQHATELAKYIWQLKNNNFNYSIKCSIASKVYGCANSLSCKLCLMEKY